MKYFAAMAALVAATIVLVCFPLFARAQWVPSQSGSCQSGFCVPPITQTYHWVTPADPDDAHRVYLYRGNEQIGGYDYNLAIYRAYDAGRDTWTDPSDFMPIRPPVRKPSLNYTQIPSWKTNGVNRDKVSQPNDTQPTYKVNGQCVTETEAIRALGDIGGATLDDDSQKMWLVVTGTDDKRTEVIKDLTDPTLKDFKNSLRVWTVPDDHFSLMDRETNQPMYLTGGHPSITLMASTGEVLYAQNGYQAGDLQEIRKKDPNYKPEPTKKEAIIAARTNGILPLILIGGGLLFVIAMAKK